MIQIGRLPGQYSTAGLLGFALGLVIFVVVSKGAIESPWPIAMKHYDQHLAGWISLRINSLVPEFFPSIATRYGVYLASFPAGTPAWHLTWRFDGALLLSLIAGLLITWIVGRGQPDTRIIAGRQLFEGKAAHRELRERATEDCAISGKGLKLHPTFDWYLSNDRASRSVLCIGSIGGGKTVAIRPLLDAAISRGDRIVLYDNKGDFTSTMTVPFVLITPWDSRSDAWDVARDCTTQQDARELAARLIPASQDPMWSSAARQILSAVIQKLQHDLPKTWSWRDLYKSICLSQDALAQIVTRYSPEARATASEGKTVEGILINFSSYMTIIADLAAAWGDTPEAKRFSISEWLHDDNPPQKVIVMQGSGRYQELMRGCVQSIISMLAGRISSPEYGENKTPLFFCLDEFPQLGRIDVASVLETGRSKKVAFFLGTQDMAKLVEIYGEHAAQAWEGMIGTKIVVRVNSGATAQYIAKELVGYATIEKTIIHEGKPQAAATQQQLVLEPSDISDYLGPTKTGIRAVLLGFGDAFILEWPFTSSPKLREASIEAPWVTGGVKSNQPLPPLPNTTGAPPMTPTTTAQPSQANPIQGLPKLKLRAPTAAEMLEMASTGTDIRFAPEPLANMQAGADIVTGGAA